MGHASLAVERGDVRGYMLKCESCGWEWAVTIAEAARSDRLYLRCPKCQARRAETIRTCEAPWPLDGAHVCGMLNVTAAQLWEIYRAAADPVGRLAESLLENGQGLENGGPLTQEDARLVAETAWQWAADMAPAAPWERRKMDAHAREALDVVGEWTATLARVRLLPRELQASMARAVNAVLAADGDKSAALKRYHERMATAKGDMAIIAALEGLVADLEREQQHDAAAH